MDNQDIIENASCPVFNEGRCRSCGLLFTPPGSRKSTKLTSLTDLSKNLRISSEVFEQSVYPSAVFPSRTKIKLSVSGDLKTPTIGLIDDQYEGVPLLDCPLIDGRVSELLCFISKQIAEYKLTPYNIKDRNGELKNIIVLHNQKLTEGILRFVLRSTEALPRIKKFVPILQSNFPWLKVISVNIQPTPAAILEGPEEIVLTTQSTIKEQYGSISVNIAPQSFIQVTPEVASNLYETAAKKVADLGIKNLLDLYCGVGPFSLSCAKTIKNGLGLELSSQAIECANIAAKEQNFHHLSFRSFDVDKEIDQNTLDGFDGVLLNPPRRGASKQLISAIIQALPKYVLYSSCNPETLARDIEILSAKYSVESLKAFDMFPLTNHLETLAVLKAY